jgi:hypothetical protein
LFANHAVFPLCMQAIKEVADFMFTANVALQNIDHKNLKAAFKALGVTLPSRKTLSGRILTERYEEVSLWGHCSRSVTAAAATAAAVLPLLLLVLLPLLLPLLLLLLLLPLLLLQRMLLLLKLTLPLLLPPLVLLQILD